jgi:phosphatidylglycerol:prolipoprotein diacylglycerol transferase
MNTIGFPGLGIEPFTVNKVAFTVFGFDIVWYAIIVTASILCGIFYSFWRASKSEGISSDDMTDVAIFTIPAAVIGARIYYIVFNWSRFPTFRSFFGGDGLAIYGGIIAALAVGYAVCRFKKLPVLKVFDAGTPAIMLGQIIGRWGNFMNAEAYGSATDLPWRMAIAGVGEVHPTFLYESLWNLLGFAAINLFIYNRKKFDGQIFLIYITWYGLGRMLIEGLRTDSLMLGDFRVSQILAGLCLVGGLILIIWMTGQAKIKELENDPGYKSVYSSALARMTRETEIAEAMAERDAEAAQYEAEPEKAEESGETDGGHIE